MKSYISNLLLWSMMLFLNNYGLTPMNYVVATDLKIATTNNSLIAVGFSTVENLVYQWCCSYSLTNGIPNPAFGDDGITLINLDNNNNLAYGCVIQPSDEKILIAGTASDQFATTRLNTDGTLDNTFGSGGSVQTIIGGYSQSYALALIPSSSNIVVAGISISNGNPIVALTQYTPSGALEGSFGSGGIVTTYVPQHAYAYSVIVQDTDEKMVIAGSNDNTVLLIRYNTDGTLDNTFGSGGIVTTAIGGSTVFYTLAQQSDGKLVAAGASDNKFTIVRYNTDGSIDTSFNTTGIITITFDKRSQAKALIIQPDNKILVIGNSEKSTFITRHMSDGTIDTTFGNNGVVTVLIGKSGEAASLVLDASNRIVITVTTLEGCTLIRFLSDGSIDETFGENGIITYPANTTTESQQTTTLLDIKSIGSNGGTSLADQWTTRELNTIKGSRSSITLNNNQFTLLPGRYSLFATVPAYQVDNHLTRLFNITQNITQDYGSNAVSNNSTSNISTINTEFTLDTSTTFEIQHKTKLARPKDGLGFASGYGINEIYTQVSIKKNN